MSCDFWSNEVNCLHEDCDTATSAKVIDVRFCSGFTDYGVSGLSVSKSGTPRIKAISGDSGMSTSGGYAILDSTGADPAYYISNEFYFECKFYLLSGFSNKFLFGGQSGIGGSYVFGFGFGNTHQIRVVFGVYGVSESMYIFEVGEIAVNTWHTLVVDRGVTDQIHVVLNGDISVDFYVESRDLFNATTGDLSIGNIGYVSAESAPCYIHSFSLIN